MMRECLNELFVKLHAIYILHRTAHWTAKGDLYYSDHLLFERLYSTLDDEIDELAERLVDSFDDTIVDPRVITAQTHKQVVAWTQRVSNMFECAEYAELDVLDCIERCMHEIELRAVQTLGWNDFLGKVASTHERNIYLIRRRQYRDE